MIYIASKFNLPLQSFCMRSVRSSGFFKLLPFFSGNKAKIGVDVGFLNIGLHRKHIFEYALLYKEYPRNIQHKSTPEI